MTTHRALPTVVYVGGYSRSGSTLLDLVLAHCFGAFGGGELTRLVHDWDRHPCSCGELYPDCDFWGALRLDRLEDRRRAQDRVQARRIPGRGGRARRRDVALDADTIRAVFGHARDVSGRGLVIDSSKSARGAAHRGRAISDAGLDVRFVHLLRSPYSVAGSYADTGSNRAAEGLSPEHRTRVLRAMLGWILANRRAATDTASGRWPAARIAYEDLARDPEVVVDALASQLSLSSPLGVPGLFSDAAGHAVAGNRMRRVGEVKFVRRAVPVVPAELGFRYRVLVRSMVAVARQDHGYRVGPVVETSPGCDVRPPDRGGVVHVCTRFAGGGSERRLVDAIDATPELRHRVLFGPESDFERVARELGAARVAVVPGLRNRAVTPWSDLRAGTALRRVVRSERPAVIHTVQSKAGMLGRLVASRAARRIHSVSALNFGPGYPMVVSFIARNVEKALGPRTDRYLVASGRLWDAYRDAGIGAGREATVVRASIPLAAAERAAAMTRCEARRRLELPVDAPLVVFVGRMEPSKGAHLLPVVHRALIARSPGVVFVVAGSGALMSRVEAEMAHSAGDVRLLGRVGDIPTLLRAADCVVSPSPSEGMPQVLVQAAIVDTPFATFDDIGSTELIGLGARGRIVPAGDVEELAAQVLALVAEPATSNRFDASSWRPEDIGSAWRIELGGPA